MSERDKAIDPSKVKIARGPQDDELAKVAARYYIDPQTSDAVMFGVMAEFAHNVAEAALAYHAKQNAIEPIDPDKCPKLEVINQAMNAVIEHDGDLFNEFERVYEAAASQQNAEVDNVGKYIRIDQKLAQRYAKLESFVNRLMQFEMSGEREIFGRIAWQKDAAHDQPSFKVGERLADGSYDVVWAKTPLEAIYAYLEQADGGEE